MKRKSSITTRPRRVAREPLPLIHPGEFLHEILEEAGLSQAAFARAVGLSPMRISHVVKGSRPITGELALLFGRAFGQAPEYWMNLQHQYELALAERALGDRLEKVERVV